ncbi:MAG: ABC transporter permease [Deinococcales bacterium]
MALWHVIEAELFKVLRKRRLYVLFLLLWLALPALLILIGFIIKNNVGDSFVDEGEMVSTAVQGIASPIAISRLSLFLLSFPQPSYFMIVVALMAALFMGEERTHNMWKTILTSQPNRLMVLLGKLIAAMLLMGILLAGACLSGMLFGTLAQSLLDTQFGEGWMELLGFYAYQWLFALPALLFAFLILWLFRNIALGMVTVMFLPIFLESLYTFYRLAVGFDRINRFNALLEVLQIQNTLKNLPKYFWTTNLFAPARQPLAEISKAMGEDFSELQGPFSQFFNGNLQQAAITLGVYGLVFAMILFWNFRRKDVA